jgi:hypothetical protein
MSRNESSQRAVRVHSVAAPQPFTNDFFRCGARAMRGQHAEQSAADQARTDFLESRGYRVLRFWNNDVLTNLKGVLERINEALKSPHPSLSLKGRGLKKLSPSEL